MNFIHEDDANDVSNEASDDVEHDVGNDVNNNDGDDVGHVIHDSKKVKLGQVSHKIMESSQKRYVIGQWVLMSSNEPKLM